MKVSIKASTNVGYSMPVEDAILLSGHMAGICYMPDTLDSLLSEPKDKTMKRASGAISSGHHSIFDHATYNFTFEGIPKILAMVLNNEQMYTTSEKSARYTKMQTEGLESELYNKWIGLYEEQIEKFYPEMKEKQRHKYAMENARYLISVFTPATTMAHTLSIRQANYLVHFMEEFIRNPLLFPSLPETFREQLQPVFAEFLAQLKPLVYVPDLIDNKDRRLSLFAKRERGEQFGETYSMNYSCSFASVAQQHRHRKIVYEITIPTSSKAEFYTPIIIRDEPKLKDEWTKDIQCLIDDQSYPQGMLVKVNERGTVEQFVEKCKERLCGQAFLETNLITAQCLDRYYGSVWHIDDPVASYLEPYLSGPRCSFPDFVCEKLCIWGPQQYGRRLV